LSIKYICILICIVSIYSLACSGIQDYKIDLPDYFPQLIIPKNNLLTNKKIELGKRLFNDRNISIDSTIMCASCHKRDLAFADSVSISPGIKGRLGDRNSPSLINAAFTPLINKDGGVSKLDIQALIPIEDHNEMGIHILELSSRLKNDHEYSDLFHEAFEQEPNAFTIPRALSSYIRSLVDDSCVYDDYLKGDIDALTDSATRGMNLFFSKTLACGTCHSGALLTNFEFENNGLYEDYTDIGRALITLQESDQGKFRIPTLRNIALTAPYMHDGSLSTLEQVIDHYSSGGSSHPNKSILITGFVLSEKQQSDLINFLLSLTSQDLDVM